MKQLLSFAKNQLGVDLYPGQVDVLEAWVARGCRKAVLALGRRSGKGILAAIVAIYNATIEDYSADLRPNETRFIVVVAAKQEQAREFVRVVRELIAAAPSRDVRAMLVEEACTLDELAFRTHGDPLRPPDVVIRAMPCSSRSTRGLAISLLVMDEAAHMITETDGPAAGKAVYQALVPSTAQFGDRGYVMLTSSPYWQTGIFWDLYQAGLSGQAPDTFVVRRPTWAMNPKVTRESLEAEFRSDPDLARVEYGADFMEGAGAFLEAAAVQAAVVPGRTALAPILGVRYTGCIDPAFAAGGDAFTFAIGHRTGGEEAAVIVDRVEAWRGRRSPLNSDEVLGEVAALALQYGIRTLVTDQYAVVPLRDALAKRGISVEGLRRDADTAEWDPARLPALTNELKADAFSALKRAINFGKIELLDDPQLLGELVGLEIRPTPSGKPRIQASRGGHDDRAMVVAALVHRLRATLDAGDISKFLDAQAGASALVGYTGELSRLYGRARLGSLTAPGASFDRRTW